MSAGKCPNSLLMTTAGGEGIGCGRRRVRHDVSALSVDRRVHVRHAFQRQPVADAVRSSRSLLEQRRQPDPVQRHVGQPTQRVPRPARLLFLLLPSP